MYEIYPEGECLFRIFSLPPVVLCIISGEVFVKNVHCKRMEVVLYCCYQEGRLDALRRLDRETEIRARKGDFARPFAGMKEIFLKKL